MCAQSVTVGSGKASVMRGKFGGQDRECQCNPGLQTARGDMCEWEGVRARMWMDHGVKFVRWEPKKRRKKKSRSSQR